MSVNLARKILPVVPPVSPVRRSCGRTPGDEGEAAFESRTGGEGAEGHHPGMRGEGGCRGVAMPTTIHCDPLRSCYFYSTAAVFKAHI